MKNLVLTGVLALAGGAAQAAEVRVRFVERIGNTEVPLQGNTFHVPDDAPHRIRIQFGVFDDAGGPAPAGGLLGWNLGTVSVSGDPGNSINTRAFGRLTPFMFATGPNANGNPPMPSGDPFTSLTEIDAAIGTQSPFWGCDGSGTPRPMPEARVRGLNTYISVFEISTDPSATAVDYSIAVGGLVFGATEWRVISDPTPPNCGNPDNPQDDIPGSVIYAGLPADSVAVAATLNLVIPAPEAIGVLGLGALVAIRRRR